MLRYLLDTNLCIRVLRDRPSGLRLRFNENAEALTISDIVLYELLYGAERSNDPARVRRDIEHFSARLAVLPYDSEAAAHTADIRHTLQTRGCVIGPYDLMIAGHARSRGLAGEDRSVETFFIEACQGFIASISYEKFVIRMEAIHTSPKRSILSG